MSEGRSSHWLPITLTLVSAASMALEIVAGRALAPYVGMSLYTWTMIIAVVLAGLSVGHWLGGLLADRGDRPGFWVAVVLTGAAVTTGASLAALRMIAPLVGTTGPIANVGLLSMAAFFMPSLLAGVLSPLLTKMALDTSLPAHHGRVLGRMFALGALGAILGTLLAGLVLISWIGTAGSVLLIALIYAVLAMVFWLGFGHVAAAVAFIGFGIGGVLAQQVWQGTNPCRSESAYFCIRVDEISFLDRAARVMALDHLAHGVNDAQDPKFLLTPYVQGVDEIVRLRRGDTAPEAFFVGGGAYSLPRAWAARWPDARMVVAELDPEVTRTAKDAMWVEDAPGLTTLRADGRVALRDLPDDRRFDVIFGDAFHDISVPQHLVTVEFSELLSRRLRPDGIYAMNVVDKQRTPRFVLSLAKTLGTQFDHVELWLDPEAIRPVETRTTWILIASDQPTPVNQVMATYGARRTWVQIPLHAMIDTVSEDVLITLTDDFAPVDRLLGDLLISTSLSEEF